MSDRNYSGAPSFRCLSAPCTMRWSACRPLTLARAHPLRTARRWACEAGRSAGWGIL